MKKKSNISILLTLKNSTKIVHKVIMGYMNQSVSPLEIVIVGLKKDIDMIQKSKLKGGKTLRFFEFDGNKNDARNFAFKKSLGKYVLIADYDMIPSKNLLEECEKISANYDALLIPEFGINKKDFKSKIFRLEKMLVMKDEGSLTPRFFVKNLFNNKELPFNPKYGVLDEWGFYINLNSKKATVGTVKAYFTVKDELSYSQRFIKNYNKGFFSHSVKEHTKSAKMRLNPVKRGYNMFMLNIGLFVKYPLEFISLFILKFIDLAFFQAGYFAKIFKNTP